MIESGKRDSESKLIWKLNNNTLLLLLFHTVFSHTEALKLVGVSEMYDCG